MDSSTFGVTQEGLERLWKDLGRQRHFEHEQAVATEKQAAEHAHALDVIKRLREQYEPKLPAEPPTDTVSEGPSGDGPSPVSGE